MDKLWPRGLQLCSVAPGSIIPLGGALHGVFKKFSKPTPDYASNVVQTEFQECSLTHWSVLLQEVGLQGKAHSLGVILPRGVYSTPGKLNCFNVVISMRL